MIITIDGPAASGKSTVARGVSERLSIPYLETGLAYRGFGYIASLEGLGEERDRILSLFGNIELRIEVGRTRILYRREDISDKLSGEEVGRLASKIATIPEFRERLNELFRDVVGGSQAVVEGRDAGTHIFPDADIKFFITASAQERARRRYNQLISMGKEADYERILNAIIERDRRDMSRPKYPFKPAEDAIIIDTSGMTPEQVLNTVMRYIDELHP